MIIYKTHEAVCMSCNNGLMSIDDNENGTDDDDNVHRVVTSTKKQKPSSLPQTPAKKSPSTLFMSLSSRPTPTPVTSAYTDHKTIICKTSVMHKA